MELVKSLFVTCPETRDRFWVRSSPNPSLSFLWVNFTDSFRFFPSVLCPELWETVGGMLTMYVHFTNTDDLVLFIMMVPLFY